jgi:hypothetical protein
MESTPKVENVETSEPKAVETNAKNAMAFDDDDEF